MSNKPNEYPLGYPCGYRPPGTDDLYSWASWEDHLAEMHGGITHAAVD
jgi:hypothetical protein